MRRRGEKLPFIITTNDRGRRVIKGPYLSPQELDKAIEKIDRPYEVAYIPAGNVRAASPIVRERVSNSNGIDEASRTRFTNEI